jgi:hypothetical protein
MSSGINNTDHFFGSGYAGLGITALIEGLKGKDFPCLLVFFIILCYIMPERKTRSVAILDMARKWIAEGLHPKGIHGFINVDFSFKWDWF